MTNKIIHGDNLEVLKTYPENFFHSVVTDPPYGLKFMNKHWDYDVPQVEFWREVLRVLKPGGYVLSFGGTRTYHRMVVNIEDAGFIIRDQLQWIYGSGFPKSLNIGKSFNQLESKEWLKIKKALDNFNVCDYIEIWKNSSNNVKIVETQLLKKQITAGQDMPKENFAVLNVALNGNQENSNVLVSFAKKNLLEAQVTNTKINIVLENVEVEIKQSQDLAKSAGELLQNLNHKSLNIFTAECNVKEWLNENTEVSHKADEVLKILRGNKKYSNEEIINVLIAVIPSVLKLTILNQSKTFQNLDMKSKMECASVINVIITEYTAGNLISNMVAILKGKAIDKLQGNEREKIGERLVHDIKGGALMEARDPALKKINNKLNIVATKGFSDWEGYGTALKPANEPICLAMKPLSEKNFAENVLKHGAGGLNIDGCRVGTEEKGKKGMAVEDKFFKGKKRILQNSNSQGRFPSNVILDEEAGAMLNGEARFFYCAKASSSERNAGMRWDSEAKLRESYYVSSGKSYCAGGMQASQDWSLGGGIVYSKNHHATVKPLSLMRYLVRLITPKGGIVLEPFAGSGTTLLAAKKEGFEFVGIERELEYCKIAEQRLESVAINETLF